jgi:hypothetical protein
VTGAIIVGGTGLPFGARKAYVRALATAVGLGDIRFLGPAISHTVAAKLPGRPSSAEEGILVANSGRAVGCFQATLVKPAWLIARATTVQVGLVAVLDFVETAGARVGVAHP